MKLSTVVLGMSVTNQLMKKETEAVLVIGKDSFTRADLSSVACWNFVAAANLSAILNRELDVENTKDVYDNVSFRDLSLPHLGAISLAVLGAAFEAKNLGGETPLESWVQRHQKTGDVITTFVSAKKREAKSRQEARRQMRLRTATRRGKAHQLRVERFETRHTQKVAI